MKAILYIVLDMEWLFNVNNLKLVKDLLAKLLKMKKTLIIYSFKLVRRSKLGAVGVDFLINRAIFWDLFNLIYNIMIMGLFVIFLLGFILIKFMILLKILKREMKKIWIYGIFKASMFEKLKVYKLMNMYLFLNKNCE
jgi:hypothetical protein